LSSTSGSSVPPTMYASRLATAARAASRVGVSTHVRRLGPQSARLLFARSLHSQIVVRKQQDQNKETSQAPTFKIDEAIDEYKDVSATREQVEKNYREPPIPLTSKQGEHAGALFASASIVNAMEAVERDLAWFSEAFETVPEFQQFISTVMTDKTIQRRLLQGVMKGAGFHRLTQKFIVVELFESGDLKLLPEIAAVYAQIMKAYRKDVPVVFTFASLPDKDFLTRQIERVQKYRLDPDATPQWEFRINPALVGGFTVEIGSNFKGDFSLAHQFQLMRQQLKQAEEKWEHVRPKEVKILGLDSPELFNFPLSFESLTPTGLVDPYKLSQEQVIYVIHKLQTLDFDQIKWLKELDLAEYEKDLKSKIPDTDQAGKEVKKEIQKIQHFKDGIPYLAYLLEKYAPDTYKQHQSIFQ